MLNVSHFENHFEERKIRLTYDNINNRFVIMIRTQISLAPSEYKLAKEAARRQGISLAELLRRSLRAVLPVKKGRPWMRYVGMVASGNPQSSQEIDDIIYGQKD